MIASVTKQNRMLYPLLSEMQPQVVLKILTVFQACHYTQSIPTPNNIHYNFHCTLEGEGRGRGGAYLVLTMVLYTPSMTCSLNEP